MRLAPAVTCVLVATCSALGCSSLVNKQAAASTYRILIKSQEAAKRQSDLELARAAIPGGLLQLEAFSLAYPEHAGFKALHAETFCQYAVAFVFDDWEDATLGGRATEAAQLAERLRPLVATCADLSLALLPRAWREARAAGADAVRGLLAGTRREHVAPLLWLATTDAVLIALDPLRNFGRLPTVEAVLTRCTELAPGFRDAEAELLLATLQAGRGAVFGNADGQAWFARARARAGEGALMIDVMYARGAAVTRKDRALFVATLERVLAADVTRWPERRLGNELARRKARRYLAAAATLIP